MKTTSFVHPRWRHFYVAKHTSVASIAVLSSVAFACTPRVDTLIRKGLLEEAADRCSHYQTPPEVYQRCYANVGDASYAAALASDTPERYRQTLDYYQRAGASASHPRVIAARYRYAIALVHTRAFTQAERQFNDLFNNPATTALAIANTCYNMGASVDTARCVVDYQVRAGTPRQLLEARIGTDWLPNAELSKDEQLRALLVGFLEDAGMNARQQLKQIHSHVADVKHTDAISFVQRGTELEAELHKRQEMYPKRKVLSRTYTNRSIAGQSMPDITYASDNWQGLDVSATEAYVNAVATYFEEATARIDSGEDKRSLEALLAIEQLLARIKPLGGLTTNERDRLIVFGQSLKTHLDDSTLESGAQLLLDTKRQTLEQMLESDLSTAPATNTKGLH